jgi:hypothetical protein
MRQRSRPAVPDDTAVVENLLKLGGGSAVLVGCQVYFPANVIRVKAGNVGHKSDLSELDWRSRPEATECGSGILLVKGQLRLNRGQPKRLHLGVPRKASIEVLRQRLGSCRLARCGKGKRGFDLDTLTRGNELQTFGCCLHRFRSVAECGFAQGGILLPDGPTLLAVSVDGGVYGPLGQFPRLAQMTSVSVRVGCERKPKVLCLFACEPHLLFSHRAGICRDKSQSIESVVENEII